MNLGSKKMAVVIDAGTDTTKCGLSGANGPSIVFPTVVGTPNASSSSIRGIYVGLEAEKEIHRETLDGHYPIDQGIVTDWDAMEAIWRHIFDTELRITSEQQDVLLIEPPDNSKKNKEKAAQILFETFGVGGLFLGSSAVLSLYSVRKLNGFVLSSGDGCTHCVPVYDGAALPHNTIKFDLTGKDVSEYLGKMLEEKDFQFSSSIEKEICVRDMKEKFAYVADDFAEEMASPVSEEKYKLPDKTVVKLAKERFKCTEAMFQPYLAGKQTVGVHKFVYQSINKCDVDIQDEMYGNILLSGGNTLFPYFPSRLQKEVSLLAPQGVNVNIIANPDRQDAAWIGGSILAEMSTFQNMMVFREDYDEYGPSIIRRKSQ